MEDFRAQTRAWLEDNCPGLSEVIGGPAVGLFADQEIKLIRGSLFVNEPCRLEREIIALSEGRRVESHWVMTSVFDKRRHAGCRMPVEQGNRQGELPRGGGVPGLGEGRRHGAGTDRECKRANTMIDLVPTSWRPSEIRLNQFAKMAPHIISISDIPKVC